MGRLRWWHWRSIVAAIAFLIDDLRRAAWRHECEAILTEQFGWSREGALVHVTLLEEIADDLVAQGKLARFPTAREALGISKPKRIGTA